MEKNRRNKGITLVTLVVTIIILLILAGITIIALTGDNGLIKRSKQAKIVAKESQNLENEILEDYENQINGILEGITRENTQTSTYKETLLFEGFKNSGSVTFLDNHEISEFDAIKFLFGGGNSKNSVWGAQEKEITTSNWNYLIQNGYKGYKYTLGLYGWAENNVDLYNLSQTGFYIGETVDYYIFRIIGINY